MANKTSQVILSATPVREFGHENHVTAVAVFPDRRRMVTGSYDKTVLLWDLKTGEGKKMGEHDNEVLALAVSPNGKLIASSDNRGNVIAWDGETGKPLAQPNMAAAGAHYYWVRSLDFSPDGTVLAGGACGAESISSLFLWSTETWQQQGDQIPWSHRTVVSCVRYSNSPSRDSELVAVATSVNIEIYNPGTGERFALFQGHAAFDSTNASLAWTPDGRRLLSGGGVNDPTIREWNALTASVTWNQVGDPWKGHTSTINAIAINPAGTLVASASEDNNVRLWLLSDKQTIAIFLHHFPVKCITFSMDGKHVLSGGDKISEWPAEGALREDAPKAEGSTPKILAINAAARSACITGDLATAEKLLTQEIDVIANDYISYANRSFVLSRKLDWDRALQDANESIRIKRSLIGFISKGIALSGKKQAREARKAFDLAFIHGDSKTNHILLLIKAIALFNVDEQEREDALQHVQDLAEDSPDIDTLACRVVEAYFHVQLGIIALNVNLHNEALEHFSAAVKASADFPKSLIHSIYEEFTVLFGWDLKSLWQTAYKQQCRTLIQAGRIGEAFEPYRVVMNASDEATQTSLCAWFSTLKQECVCKRN